MLYGVSGGGHSLKIFFPMLKTSSMKIYQILLTLFLGIVFQKTSAQRDSAWLKNNDLGNRFEGSYSKEVGNTAIELVSFTGGFEPYEFGKKQALKVKFYLPEGERYFLKAEELRPVQYYWMQDKNTKGKAGWNLFDNWQADARLKQFGVPPDNLGVLVQAGEPGSRKIAPALVFHQSSADSVGSYVAKFRLGQAIQHGGFRVFRGLFDRAIPSADSQVHHGKIRSKSGGSFFPVQVPASVLGQKAGWFTLMLELTKVGSDEKILYSFSFYHQPLL